MRARLYTTLRNPVRDCETTPMNPIVERLVTRLTAVHEGTLSLSSGSPSKEND